MKKYVLFFIIMLLCSCNIHNIDENYAAAVAKKALLLSEPVAAQKLKGGYSGAPIFKVTTNSKKYIVRFLRHKSKVERQEEISCLKVSSYVGYGPHIYFADVEQAIIIMEYLSHKKISGTQRDSEELYIALAHLLQKIHHGPKYQKSINLFDKMQERTEAVKAILKNQNIDIPVNKLEKIIAMLRKTLTSYLTIAPCHNDLHPSNLIFLGNEFRAIDYERAAQSEPYFDIATIAIYYCFNTVFEHVLLSTYLGHKPSLQEKSKLYLMKQVAWIRYALTFLILGSEKIGLYATLQVPSYWDFISKRATGKIADFESPEHKIKLAKTMINLVIANAQTQEFRDAIDTLGKTCKE